MTKKKNVTKILNSSSCSQEEPQPQQGSAPGTNTEHLSAFSHAAQPQTRTLPLPLFHSIRVFPSLSGRHPDGEGGQQGEQGRPGAAQVQHDPHAAQRRQVGARPAAHNLPHRRAELQERGETVRMGGCLQSWGPLGLVGGWGGGVGLLEPLSPPKRSSHGQKAVRFSTSGCFPFRINTSSLIITFL